MASDVSNDKNEGDTILEGGNNQTKDTASHPGKRDGKMILYDFFT
jgi:6-phosphogluconate dehydrogenase (decarboxylating)